MRRNEQAEKQKHGIAYDLSSPLETGVPQRDFRVWLHPKRRLACPLRRLPMKPNGPRRRRRIECLEEAPFTGAVIPITARRHFLASSSRAQPRDLCCTRMRVNAQVEKRKHGITCHTSRPLEMGRAKGAGWMCLEEAPFYAVVSMTIVQSVTPYRHFERSEKSLSFAVSRSMIGNSKRETCYPHTFGHRPIYMAAKLPPQV